MICGLGKELQKAGCDAVEEFVERTMVFLDMSVVKRALFKNNPITTNRMSNESHNPLPADACQARQWVADLGAQLAQRKISFRDPPEEPTSCCGRGCNGCVWEGYFNAVGYWCEQVRGILLEA